MVRVWKSVLAGVALLTACAAAGEAVAYILPPQEHNRLFRLLEHRPMAFFLAKGPPNSCGLNCNEWIAAVGVFDSDSPRRFREMIGKLNAKNLPVYFHSPGGTTGAGIEIGYLLREHRITASVGRTETKNCRVFDKKDLACQNSMKAGEKVDARLITKDAQCHSACVFAFAGAPQRQLPSGAFLGVHASRLQPQAVAEVKRQKISVADIQQVERRYYLEMGIHPALVDQAAKTPHQRIDVLSSTQLSNYGFQPNGKAFETPWMAFHIPGQRPVVMKAITRQLAPLDYATSRVQFMCSPDGRAYIGYRREAFGNALDATKFTDINFADSRFAFRAFAPRNNLETGASEFFQDNDILGKLAAVKTIEITEKKIVDSAQAPIMTSVSIDGLKNALTEFRKNCVPDASRTLSPRPEAGKPRPDAGTSVDKSKV